MVSINTSDDLIRAIRENPEFRATVRRELLTEELLEVPARLQALTTIVEGLAATVGEEPTGNRQGACGDRRASWQHHG